MTLCNPSRVLTRLARLMPWIKSPVLLAVSVGVAVAGLVALLLHGDALVAALSQPVSYSTLFALFLGIPLSTALHEVGHGLVLAAYGAAPNRLGVMLFYLLPRSSVTSPTGGGCRNRVSACMLPWPASPCSGQSPGPRRC